MSAVAVDFNLLCQRECDLVVEITELQKMARSAAAHSGMFRVYRTSAISPSVPGSCPPNCQSLPLSGFVHGRQADAAADLVARETHDLEALEDTPLEFVRSDLATTEISTPRQAAADVVKVCNTLKLVVHYTEMHSGSGIEWPGSRRNNCDNGVDQSWIGGNRGGGLEE